MQLTLKTLYRSDLLSIRHAVARPSASRELFYGAADILLLPVSGLFAKHDTPKEHYIANSNHALFFRTGQPYRISFPGDIGDESLLLEFARPALATLLNDVAGVQDWCSSSLHPHCLLAPGSMLNREALWLRLQSHASALEIEERSVALLAAALGAAHKDNHQQRRARHTVTMARRRRQVETVKELLTLDPAQEWTLESLASHAHTTPYHLTRIFTEEVGIPVHRYLIRTRLGKAIEAMRDGAASLTEIAYQSGFSSHSHFTSSFSTAFGMTPSASRLGWRAGVVGGR